MEVYADVMKARVSQTDAELGSMLREASATASSAMANTLAHHINNPLQSITNSIFLAIHSEEPASRTLHLEQASADLRQLSQLVGSLLLLHRPIAAEAAAEDAKPVQ